MFEPTASLAIDDLPEVRKFDFLVYRKAVTDRERCRDMLSTRFLKIILLYTATTVPKDRKAVKDDDDDLRELAAWAS